MAITQALGMIETKGLVGFYRGSRCNGKGSKCYPDR